MPGVHAAQVAADLKRALQKRAMHARLRVVGLPALAPSQGAIPHGGRVFA